VAAAGLTKGSFFHHFTGKDDLAETTAKAWATGTNAFFNAADFTRHARPYDRVMGYIALRKALLTGPIPAFSCYAGTVVGETYAAGGPVFTAAAAAVTGHIALITPHIAAALIEAGKPPTRADALSNLLQCTVQGAIILAQTTGSPAAALTCFDEIERYFAAELAPITRKAPNDPRQTDLFAELEPPPVPGRSTLSGA